MWKYVTRRIRETFERRANRFDKRHSAVVNTSKNNKQYENNNNANCPCCWFVSKKCWNSQQSKNDTNNNKWNFEQINRTWVGAITWSSALVFGWYSSQLIHFKCKKEFNANKKCCVPKISHLCEILTSLNGNTLQSLKLPSQGIKRREIEKSYQTVSPFVHLISNEHSGDSGASSKSTSSSEPSDDLGEVLNSIENRLGLAAIENGHHQDGLNLLRSAANRNHAPALYNLGLCYEQGLGVKIDEKMAMELYRSAATLHHPGALYNLGIYYGQGRGGLSCDRATAVRLLRLAAIQGQQDAITALKSLEEPTKSTSIHPNMNEWNKPYTAYTKHENIIPTQSALFIENVNLLNTPSYYESVLF